MSREDDLVDRHRRVISESMQILMYPFAMEAQEGATMRGVDGDEVIDFFAAWAVGNAGYRHPRVLDRLEAQVERGYTNSALSVVHEPVVELAERLVATTPGGFEKKVWFGHAGSDAGDLLARALPAVGEGDVILTFEGSYHGGLSGSAAISGHALEGSSGGAGVEVLPFPDSPHTGHDPAAECEAVLEAAKTSFEATDVAGLITEPLQSDGGIRVPPPGFLEGLADLCADYDAYFVVDEVKAGLGRTGEFFAFEHANVVPDAVMLGKPLGGGLPISAVVGRSELVDYEPATHMMTTAAAPLPVAAALGTLDAIERDGLIERADRLGDRLHEGLVEVTRDLDAVFDVRGRGLMQGVELVEPSTGEPAADLAAKTAIRARQLGLLVAYVGANSNVLELTPPLTIDDALLDEGIERLGRAIREAADGAVDDALLARFAGW